MTVTLQPVFEALGYRDASQQRALVTLLQSSGAFGDVKGVDGVLSDKQADAILKNLTFNDYQQAANMLHDITQEHLIKRTPGAERDECLEPAHFRAQRAQLMDALQKSGMLDEMKPARQYYDHVLIAGAREGEVDTRFDTLKQLWDQGVRFGKIYMLGSERRLQSDLEPSAGKVGPDGSFVCTEMAMMESHYYQKSANWPKELQNVRIFEVNTFNKPTGERANTQDTIKSWLQTYPKPGNVLLVSNQPYVRYQDAAVKSVLPQSFHVDSVGDAAPKDLKISVAVDSLARQIDVGFAQVMKKLDMRKPKMQTQLVMIDPANIQVDAPTYQFRSGGDAAGVTEKGRYKTDHWNPVLHGDPILVHERSDGRIFVADGHHRVDLAKRLNTEGEGPGKLAALVLREADGYTAQDVKIIAAYKNIAHGKTDPVDTARVFKEANSGKVNLDLLPHLQMDKGNLTMSYKMSKLSDKALDEVAKGNVPAPMAAELADRIPDDQPRQERVMQIISKKLQQSYDTPANTHPTTVNVRVPAKAEPAPSMASFVEKLAMQRAKPPVLGMSC